MRYLIDIICCIADAATMFYFIEAIAGHNRNLINRGIILVIMSACVVGWSFLSGVFSDTIVYIGGTVILVTAFSFLYRTRIYIKILLGIGFEVIGYSSELIVAGILQRMSVATLANENEMYVGLCLSKLLCLIFIIIISLIVKKETTIREKEYKLPILTCLIVSIAVLLLVNQYVLSDIQGFNEGICLMAVLVIALNMLMYGLLDRITAAGMSQEHEAVLEKELFYQQKNHETITEKYKQIRRLIHDTDKHLKSIRQLVEDGHTDDALKYINETLDEVKDAYQHIDTGNAPIDALVSDLIYKAQTGNITLQSDINIDSSQMSISNSNLTIILGNLIDNAYNAAMKCAMDKKISIAIKSSEGMLTINIANSYNFNDTPIGKKGYGIENIEKVVNEEGGFYDTECNDNLYRATVVLPFSVRKHTIQCN